MAEITTRTGTPFEGTQKEQLAAFLKAQELDYDENIEYTIELLDGDRIIGTGSSHGNVIKCVAVARDYQGQNLLGKIMTGLVEHFFEQGITHYFGYTKPKNKEVFGKMGLYPVEETGNILLLENRQNGLEKYMKKLEKETASVLMTMGEEAQNQASDEIGAVVANCNPFTLGHRYLIEEAAKQCRYLHLFILSEEQKFMTSKERMELAMQGIQGISNVIVHKTSDYLVSPAVFPTYFIKDKANAYQMNCELDIRIFCEHIAKRLGINKRFVGSEPECKITALYNECLKEKLPECGIKVEELPRKQVGTGVISAAAVRRAVREGRLADVKDMLPETTYRFLSEERQCV